MDGRRPKPSFKVGDYVLVGRPTKGTLNIATKTGVLLVTEVHGSGVSELRGSDGVQIYEQVKNVAHSPVPVLDPIVGTTTTERVDPIHCREWGRRGDEGRMVFRDLCNEENHLWCVIYCLDSVPIGH